MSARETRCFIVILILFTFTTSYGIDIGKCPLKIKQPCNPKQIKFVLSTTSGKYNLNPFETKLPFDFETSVPLKIVIHGYGGLNNDYSTGNITAAYEELGYNVILVDWGLLAETPCYVTAYVNTWHVGQCVAILAVSLVALGISPLKLHVLGFSLGAHVASFASNNLEKALGMPFGRITGLDPALPFFATLSDDWKLDASDAKFVDVIHTNAGSLGKIEASGHVDFYINGGSKQPQCEDKTIPQLCSHFMSGKYFSDTIRNNRIYYGFQCKSILDYFLGFCDEFTSKRILMGEKSNPRSRGIYFVNTEGSYFNALLFF